MNTNLERWLQTLETTDKEQGRGYMRISNGLIEGDAYCSLGIAGDMLRPDEWHFHGVEAHHFGGAVYELQGHVFMLPGEVAEELGINTTGQRRCMKMNDTFRLSFKQIAKVIRTIGIDIFNDNSEAAKDKWKRACQDV